MAFGDKLSFKTKYGVLSNYRGHAETVVIPDGVHAIEEAASRARQNRCPWCV